MKIASYLETRAHNALWSIQPDETLYSFANALSNYSVGALTVLSNGGALMGIISERDFVQVVAEYGAKSLDMSVAEFMTREVITCSPEDDMLETLEKMNAHHIRHIPVMKDGQPSTMLGIREFDAACHELKALASTDALTGVSNRSHFMSVLDKEVERHRRINAHLSVAVLKIDSLERIDKNPGNNASDDLLVSLAQFLTKHFRTYDGIGRLSNDEFAVIFPNSDINDAEAACERLRRALRRIETKACSVASYLAISQGLTSIQGYRVPAQEIINVASTLLTEGKTAGRDCIVARSYGLVTSRGVSFSI